MILPTWFPVRQTQCTRMQIFALFVGTCAFVKADAEGFVAMRFDKV